MTIMIISGEYKEECGTCALIAEGSTMPYSDNTCPQVMMMMNIIIIIFKIMMMMVMMMMMMSAPCHIQTIPAPRRWWSSSDETRLSLHLCHDDNHDNHNEMNLCHDNHDNHNEMKLSVRIRYNTVDRGGTKSLLRICEPTPMPLNNTKSLLETTSTLLQQQCE